MKEYFELHAEQDLYKIVLKRNSTLAKKILSILFKEDSFITENIENNNSSNKLLSLYNNESSYEISAHISDTTPTSSFSWSLQFSPELIEQDKLLKSEYEWLLLYGYALFKEGKVGFEKADLKKLYIATNRLNQSNYKSFSTNIKKCLSKNYFSMNECGSLFLTEEGKNLVFSRLKTLL